MQNKGITRRGFMKSCGVAIAGTAAVGGGALSLAGCSSGSSDTTSDSAKEFDLNDWDSVLEAAKGQTVNYHQSGSNTVMNEWLNSDVKEAVEKYGITWSYTPATGTVDIVNLVSSEMNAGKTEDGSVDFMWINGENFFSLKDNGYLYGPFLYNLPSLEYCDQDNINLSVDCGVDIEGLEAPYQATYDVFWADTAKVGDKLPTNVDGLKELIINNPGQFTYAEPGNANGTYFVGTIIAATCGEEIWNRINQEQIDKDELTELIQPAIEWLRDINPYLWSNGSTFPANGSQVIQLLGDGEISILFNSMMPRSYIRSGTVPETVKAFFLDDAVINDYWYLCIPANAAHKAAALVAINEIMTPDLQMSQFEEVGYYPFSPYDLMTSDAKKKYDETDWEEGLIDPKLMSSHTVPQANGQNNDTIEDIWHDEVFGK